LAIVLASCSSPDPPSASVDASEEVSDAGPDARSDAGSASGVDAGSDSGWDSGREAGFDAGRQGPYTLTNQEPVTSVVNGAGLWAKRLPSNVLGHVAVAGGPYLADSDTMIHYQLDVYSVPGDRGEINADQTVVRQDEGVAKYYGQVTDPVYVFKSCTWNGHDGSGPGTYNVPFHMPSAAQLSAGGSDKFWIDWDQTNDNIFTLYDPGIESVPACPGGGHAGTLADPCPLSITGATCGINHYDANPSLPALQWGWATIGVPGMEGMVRMQELVEGHIGHAIYLDAACTSGTYVYPTQQGIGPLVCSQAGVSNATGIPAAGLVFLDYTPTQLADLKTKLAPWQYPFIEAMTLYGGYFGDTAGVPQASGIYPARFESEVAYRMAGVATPHPSGFASFYAWLASQPTAGCFLANGGYKCPMSIFEHIPAEPNNVGKTGTDIAAHMHVADQCVPKGMMGLMGGCP
jgi:hypothetical protein